MTLLENPWIAGWNWAVPELFIGDAVVSRGYVHPGRNVCSSVSLISITWLEKGAHKFLEENAWLLKHIDIICMVSVSSLSMQKLHSVITDFPNVRWKDTPHDYSSHGFS